jgi:hypothetical protein
MDIELFIIQNSYGYKVGRVYQEYEPDLEGYVPMTEERALECANIVMARIAVQ